MFSIEAKIRSPGLGGRLAVVADDDLEQRAALVQHLSGRGYTVAEANDGYEALSIIGSQAPLLALLRRRLVADDADRAAALARMLYPQTRIIITANHPELVPGEAPFTVLTRPVDLHLLDRCLEETA
ncbi:MAG TPA: response regulator [Azospirillum sp.]|nr:response regulator [Azospirillum sp.]